MGNLWKGVGTGMGTGTVTDAGTGTGMGTGIGTGACTGTGACHSQLWYGMVWKELGLNDLEPGRED